MKRYIIYGGYVTSKDNDTHYVSPYKIAKLHGLNPYKSNVILMHDDDNDYIIRMSYDIILYPRNDGNYRRY